MPRKSRKKGGAGGGSSRKKGGVGGVSSSANPAASDFEAIGRDVAATLDALHLEVVEVMYAEPSLKRVQFLSSDAPVSPDWLSGCVQESYNAWRDHLPTVQPAHLTGRLIPATAQSASDIGVSKGMVVVELDDAHVDGGLVAQIAAARAQSLTSEVKWERRFKEMDQHIKEMDQRFTEMQQSVLLEREAAHSTCRRDIQDLQQRLQERLNMEAVQMTVHDELHQQLETVRDELHQLQAFTRKGLELSNKVKLRIALTLARSAVEKAVGRAKEESENWAVFFGRFSTADWSKVGVSKQRVKQLLADGAYGFNEAIHNCPAQEVVGSVAGMKQGPMRSAWEEIFFLAFQKQVADELFVDEVDYAAQQQLLGQS